MKSASKSLLKKALELDIDERTVLGHSILMSVREEAKEFEKEELSEEIKQELERRFAYMEAHPDEWVSWEEVKRGMQKRRRK